jgi:MYXO-CTERM domain-containing protein
MISSSLTSIACVWLAAAPPAALPASSLSRFRESFPSAQVHLRDGSEVASFISGVGLGLQKGAPEDVASGLVSSWPEVLGFDPALTGFALERAVVAGELTAFRFRQQHQGLPVLNGEVVVSVDGRGRVHSISNGLQRLSALSTAYSLSGEAALRAAVGAVRPTTWPGKAQRLEKVIAGVEGEWRAVWLVEFGSLKPLGRWRVLVDPEAPRVLAVSNLIKTIQGYAYEVSPEVANYAAVDLADLSSPTQLVGKWVDVYSDCMPLRGYGYDCTDANRQAAADATGNFLLTPAEGAATDPFAEVQSYYHLGMMHEFFKGLGFTGVDLSMAVAANFTLDQDLACNAAYIGDAMVIGLCDTGRSQVNFAYDSLTIMHEYTHGAVDHSAGLAMTELDGWGLAGMPGGLNEGYADFFPAVVLDDHVVGRHVAPKLGQGTSFRDLEDFKKCPDDLAGEVHDDSVIWSGANWEAYKAVNKDPALPAIVFQGLVSLASTATFDDAARATLAAATAAGNVAVHDALSAAYGNHGVLGCARSVGVPTDSKITGSLYNPYMLQLNTTSMPGEVQYRLAVPEGARTLDFSIKATALGGTTDKTTSLNVLVSAGQHVVYKGSTTTAQWNSGGKATLSISAPAGGVYYILPVGKNFGQSMGYSFEITPEVVVEAPDAGVELPDAAAPVDAAQVVPDAASVPPDASEQTDASAPGLDASQTVVADAAVAEMPDAGGQAKSQSGGCSCGPSGDGGLAFLPMVLLGLTRFALRRIRRS